MKRWLSNLLTVLLSCFVLLVGTLFAYYVLPILTDDAENVARREPIQLSNPQEILSEPVDRALPIFYFPSLFADRISLADGLIGEPEIQERDSFLNDLAEQLDTLFNLKLYGKILDTHTEIWRYDAEQLENSVPLITDDVFYVDVLFTDARAQSWRITACGTADQVFHVSCIGSHKEGELLPVFTQQQLLRIYDADDKLRSAADSFYSKLVSLSDFNRIITLGIYEPMDTFLIGSSTNVLWSVHFESDNRYLVSGFFQNSRTPFSYTFLDFSGEMQHGYYFPELIEREQESWLQR